MKQVSWRPPPGTAILPAYGRRLPLSHTYGVIHSAWLDLVPLGLNLLDGGAVANLIPGIDGVPRRPEIELRALRRPVGIVKDVGVGIIPERHDDHRAGLRGSSARPSPETIHHRPAIERGLQNAPVA